MSPRISKKKNVDREVSSHTRLGFWLGFIAGIVELWLGFSYLWSESPSDRVFGQLSLLEGSFALVSLYVIDIMKRKKFKIIPKQFEPSDNKTFYRMIVILGALVLIQLIFQYIPLTVRTWHRAAAVMFAGPAEELFFRGLLIQSFVFFSESVDMNKLVLREGTKIKEKREISIIDVLGIIFSSVLFALLHVNYYGDLSVLLAVLVSGLVLAFFYWWFRDLTANILAHFVLNLITVIQVFTMVVF